MPEPIQRRANTPPVPAAIVLPNFLLAASMAISATHEFTDEADRKAAQATLTDMAADLFGDREVRAADACEDADLAAGFRRPLGYYGRG